MVCDKTRESSCHMKKIERQIHAKNFEYSAPGANNTQMIGGCPHRPKFGFCFLNVVTYVETNCNDIRKLEEGQFMHMCLSYDPRRYTKLLNDII